MSIINFCFLLSSINYLNFTCLVYNRVCLLHIGKPTAKLETVVEVGKPWSNITVSRSLSALKYFYDLKFGNVAF